MFIERRMIVKEEKTDEHRAVNRRVEFEIYREAQEGAINIELR